MWNREKKEHTKPAPTLPSETELAKEEIPMSTLPGTTPGVEPRSELAAIGKSVVVKGQVYSREDLYVDGELEGAVELQECRLTIGPNAKLQANVKAREVVVLGSLHGNIDASERIEIRKGATLVGDLKTARIRIEDGAYFKGSVEILRQEVGEQAAAASATVSTT